MRLYVLCGAVVYVVGGAGARGGEEKDQVTCGVVRCIGECMNRCDEYFGVGIGCGGSGVGAIVYRVGLFLGGVYRCGACGLSLVVVIR